MSEKAIFYNECALALGIACDAFGVALVVKSDFGVSAVSSVAYSLNRVFPQFSMGIWSYMFQFLLFVLMCVILKKCSFSYIMSFFMAVIFGYTLDFAEFCFRNLPILLGGRIFYYVVGTFLIITGVALLVISKLPIMPQDLFTREIAFCFNQPYKNVKTRFDVCCVMLCLAISWFGTERIYGIGVATIVSALITGKGVHIMERFFRKRFSFMDILKR